MHTRYFLYMLAFLLLLPSSALAGVWTPTQQPDCAVWNEFPEPGESALWNGKCSDGKATGYGNLKWSLDGSSTQEYNGNLLDGKKHGDGRLTLPNGDVFTGMFRDNKKSGRGLLCRPELSCESGFWLENQSVTLVEYSAWLRQNGAPWTVEDLRIAGLTVGDVMAHPFDTGLGAPLSDMATRPQANIGRTLEYPGLTLGFIKFSRKSPLPLYILRGITVTSPEYATERGIVVGDSQEKLVSLYGQPSQNFACPPDKYCRQTCGGETCLLYYRLQTGLEWQESETEKEKSGLGFGLRNGRIVEIYLGISAFL